MTKFDTEEKAVNRARYNEMKDDPDDPYSLHDYSRDVQDMRELQVCDIPEEGTLRKVLCILEMPRTYGCHGEVADDEDMPSDDSE
jgi:hypothetical protein